MTKNEAAKEVERRLDAIEDEHTDGLGCPLFIMHHSRGIYSVTFNDPTIKSFEVEYDER